MHGPSTTTIALAAAATCLALVVASAWLLRPGNRVRSLFTQTYVNGNGVGNGAATGSSGGGSLEGGHKALPVPQNDTGPVTKEAQEWAALYAKMAKDFKENGLNPKAIEPLVSWFHGLESPTDTPWPKRYTELPEPLQFGAVRLLVVPLDDDPVVLRIAAAVTADVMRLLPEGTKVFANARGNYHCTVFHTSQPTDPRPDPTRPDGGVDVSLPPHKRRVMTAAEWDNELEAMRRLVAETPVPVLRLERVVQASTGVLLLTWTEVGEGAAVAGLRTRLRAAFPGASTKQATIIHSSLLRIVSTTPLGEAAVDSISSACERWTQRLRGTRYSPKTLWFIREQEFSTINGEREMLTLADPAAPVRHW